MHLNLFRTKRKDIADVAPVEITALWLQKCIMSCTNNRQLVICRRMMQTHFRDRYGYEAAIYMPTLRRALQIMVNINKLYAVA